MDSPKEVNRETTPVSPASTRTPAASTVEKRSIITSSVRQSTRTAAVTGINRGILAVASIIDRDGDNTFGDEDMMDLSDESSDDSDDDDDHAHSKDKEVAGEMQDDDEPLEEEAQPQKAQSSSASNGHQPESQAHGQTGGAQSQQSSAPLSTRGMMGGPDPNQARSRFVPEKPVKDAPASPTKAAPVAKSAAPTSTQKGTATTLAAEQSVPESKAASTEAQPAKPNPLGPTPAAPHGYKIVKVKKPDGTIVKAKRPIKAEEATKTTPAVPTFSTQTVSVQTPATTAPPSMPATTNEKHVDLKSEIRVTEKELLADKETGEPTSPMTPQTAQPRWITRHISRVMQILTWIVMIAFPLLFIALGIWAIKENGQPIGNAYNSISNQDPLSQAIKVAASLWPIIFAAIVAQTLKAYAAWKVERGIPLITLEQLISSHSVGGAVKQPFMLRTFNWTSILLVTLWALSPLAGQAILRMSFTKTANSIGSLEIQWIDPYAVNYNLSALSDLGYDPGSTGNSRSRMNSMYDSLLVGSPTSQGSATDYWNNVKIPVFHPENADKTGWAPVHWVNQTASMSSLIGYPNPNGTADASFVSYNYSRMTSQFQLTCLDPVLRNISDPDMQALNFSVSNSKSFYAAAEKNWNITEYNYATLPDGTMSSELSPVIKLGPGPTGVLHFGSKTALTGLLDDHIWYTRCAYDQVVLNNTISCTHEDVLDSCKVLSQKKLDKKPDYPLHYHLADALVGASNTSLGEHQDSEYFVWNPGFAYMSGALLADPWSNESYSAYPGATVYPAVTGQSLSRNLGILVNTLNLLGTNPLIYVVGDFYEIYQLLGKTTGTSGVVDGTAWTTGMPFNQYGLDLAWAVVLLVCSVILLVAGVASAMLEHRTIGPDFLGFANTAIKRSVKLPKDMNHLNARDRLSALTECEVLLQDVKPKAGMGKIALGVKDESSTYLIRGRDYR